MLVAPEVERFVERLGHAQGDLGQLCRRTHPLHDDHELVSANPAEQVLGSQGDPQPLGHLRQQAVARRVAQAVIDDLEPIQVAVQDADPAPRAILERTRQPLKRQEAVRGAGQPVVQSAVRQLQLRLTATGDVLELHHHAVRRGARDHQGAGDASPDLLPVDGAEPSFRGVGGGRGREQPFPPGLPRQAALAVDDVGDAQASELMQWPTHHPWQCLIGDQDAADGVQQRPSDRGVLEGDPPLPLRRTVRHPNPGRPQHCRLRRAAVQQRTRAARSRRRWPRGEAVRLAHAGERHCVRARS